MKLETYSHIILILKKIIEGTKFDGHVFSVGGCERDRILGNNIKDIDIVVDLPNGGIEFANWLKDNGHTKGSVVVYEHYGTAMFCLKDAPDYAIEAVQTRKECYRDIETRNPETAYGTIMDDCHRRDFTVNAIYRNLTTGEVLDLNGNSFNDIKNGVIRTCGDPDIIFNEDPLRILRAIRFKTRLGFTIDVSTLAGMIKHVDRLNIISRERITDEFTKMIQSKNAKDAIDLICSIGALKYVIPTNLSEKELKDKIYYSTIDNTPSNVEIKLSRIFNKFEKDEIENILKEMRYSNDTIKEVVWFKYHSDSSKLNDLKSLRKFMYECGNLIHFIHALSIFRSEGVDSMEIYRTAIKNVGNRMFGYKLPINGNDILNTLEIDGGPIVRRILNDLMELAFENPDITSDDCIKYVKEHYSK